MLKKTITYVDYKGNQRTEDFYFNLTRAEVMEMELGTTGGFTEMINRIIAAQNLPEIVKVFKDLVLKAYGEPSPDGKLFVKNDVLRTEFSQTEAYSNLFMELATDAKIAADFVNGIIPESTDNKKEQPASVDNKTSPQLVAPVNN